MKKALLSILSGVFVATSINCPVYAKPSKDDRQAKPVLKLSEKQVKSIEKQAKPEKSIEKQVKPVNSNSQKSSEDTKKLIVIKKIEIKPVETKKVNVKPVIKKKFADKVPSVIKFGKTVIPTTSISKGLKAEVKWDKASQTLLITKNGVTIEIVAGTKILVNGKEVEQSKLKKIRGSLIPFIKSTLNSKPAAPVDQTTTPSDNTQQTTSDTQSNTTPSGDNTQQTSSDTQSNTTSNGDSTQQTTSDVQSNTTSNDSTSTVTGDTQQTTQSNQGDATNNTQPTAPSDGTITIE
jgi:hypothetical protein